MHATYRLSNVSSGNLPPPHRPQSMLQRLHMQPICPGSIRVPGSFTKSCKQKENRAQRCLRHCLQGTSASSTTHTHLLPVRKRDICAFVSLDLSPAKASNLRVTLGQLLTMPKSPLSSARMRLRLFGLEYVLRSLKRLNTGSFWSERSLTRNLIFLPRRIGRIVAICLDQFPEVDPPIKDESKCFQGSRSLCLCRCSFQVPVMRFQDETRVLDVSFQPQDIGSSGTSCNSNAFHIHVLGQKPETWTFQSRLSGA